MLNRCYFMWESNDRPQLSIPPYSHPCHGLVTNRLLPPPADSEVDRVSFSGQWHAREWVSHFLCLRRLYCLWFCHCHKNPSPSVAAARSVKVPKLTHTGQNTPLSKTRPTVKHSCPAEPTEFEGGLLHSTFWQQLTNTCPTLWVSLGSHLITYTQN